MGIGVYRPSVSVAWDQKTTTWADCNHLNMGYTVVVLPSATRPDLCHVSQWQMKKVKTCLNLLSGTLLYRLSTRCNDRNVFDFFLQLIEHYRLLTKQKPIVK